MKILATSSVFCILIIAIFSVNAQFVSQSIDEDTIRVKRAAKSKNVNQFFRVLGNAFEEVYKRPRLEASIGTKYDLPTEIKNGGKRFKPKLSNPLLIKAKEAIQKHRRDSSIGGRKNDNPYDRDVQKKPSGHRFKEGLRKQDPPGCGVPLCTIVDMRIKSFMSMCHLVDWMTQNAKYRQVFEIQKGSCETAIKYPTRGKWLRSRWIPKRRSRAKLQKPNGCNKCARNKECNKEVCVNDNGHAKSFKNICEANKYLMKQPKSLKLVSFALGGCRDLYSQCLYTEWWDIDDPSDKGEHEGVGQTFNYLSELSDKHVHRSCSMTRIHYPVEILTTQDHRDVEGGHYEKKAHEITCHNMPGVTKPQPPYYWDANNVTCRDWKLRYCCENLWGEPAPYKVLSQKAKEGKMKKRIPMSISKDSDVFVDRPTQKRLFEDCKWKSFVSLPNVRGSDIDSIFTYSQVGGNTGNICGYKKQIPRKGSAMYIDARTVNKNKPYDETDDLMSKVSPLYGVYCDEKNNGKPCKDYKYRLCCKKKIKEDYGKWTKFGKCMGDCRANQGKKTRTKECKQLIGGTYRPGCEKVGNKYVVKDEVDCTRTDKECRDTVNWMPWEKWGTCSATCGEGKRTRKRYCTEGQRLRSGRSSKPICNQEGYEIEEGNCHSTPCPDYAFGEWTPWSKCDLGEATCGSGTRSRSRVCFDRAHGTLAQMIVENYHCSASPASAMIVQNCVDEDKPDCPRDGGWSEWRPWPRPDPNSNDEWGRCDASCGKGMKQSKRFCDNPAPLAGGAKCMGEDIKEESCENPKKCPQNCVLSMWGRWSGCLQNCVDHYNDWQTKRVRYRHIIQKPDYGGRECGVLEESKECQVCHNTLWPGTREPGKNPCVPRCPVDCEWNEWGQWQRHSCRCFKDKGKPGKKYRTRDRKVTEDFGGKQCLKLNKKPLSEDEFIETQNAKCNLYDRQSVCITIVPGKLTEWGEWTACDAPCRGHRMGTKTRMRMCTKLSGCGKSKLIDRTKCESVCNPEIWKDWMQWGHCSKTCGRGVQIRRRKRLMTDKQSRRYFKKNKRQIRKDGGSKEKRVCDMGPCGKAENPEDLYGMNKDMHDEL